MRTLWKQRRRWLGVAALLGVLTGSTAPSRAQSLDPPRPPDVVPISASVPAANARAPVAPGAPGNRQEALEARVTQLEAELQAQRMQLQRTPPVHEAGFHVAPSNTSSVGDKDKLPEPYKVGSDLKMGASWKDGIYFENAQKDFKIHLGGRTQMDWVGFNPNASTPMAGAGGNLGTNAVDFRRARLRVDGTLYEVYEFAAHYDFVNSVNDNPDVAGAAGIPSEVTGNVINVPAPTDLWWNVKELPFVGNFKVGNFKPPLGLEHLTSSRFLDFMERSFIQDAYTGAFNNGFQPGMMAYDWTENESATWALGIFKQTNNPFAFNSGSHENMLAGRLTWTPYYDEPTHGRYLLHLGCGASYAGTNDGRLRIRARNSVRNGPATLWPVVADTGFVNGVSQAMIIPELAIVYGPWLLQTEYAASFLNGANMGGVPVGGGQMFTQGYYVEALYFLTGEHREYERKSAAFGRVIPYENFYCVRSAGKTCLSRGAWQLGARFNSIDLRDGGVNGGSVQDFTLGVNWFLNPNMKVQVNYVLAGRSSVLSGAAVGGNYNGFGIRMAHDF